MLILVLIVVGVSSLYYIAPTTFDPIADNLYSSDESSNIGILNNSVVKKVGNKTSPIQGYSEVTIAGLKFYIKTEYSNFTSITTNTSVINNIGVINNTNNTDETTETNITNITNTSNELSNNTNPVNLVNHVEYNDSTRIYASNGSFDIIVTNNSSVGEVINIINSEFLTNNANDASVVTLGSNLTILHYNQYYDEGYIGEVTWVHFKVNDKFVFVGWAGNNADMYVIESFFNLN